MKRAIFVVAMMLMAGGAAAEPFLVCDMPLPEEEIASYKIYMDGEQIGTSPALTEGAYGFKYDLQGIPVGAHSFTAIATNVWGVSELSDPFLSPAGSRRPAGMQMILGP